MQGSRSTLRIPVWIIFALQAGSLEQLQAWAAWLDSCGVARSAIREVADDYGAIFDFVDPDGIQIGFIYLNLG